jgi:HEAT repeat protein
MLRSTDVSNVVALNRAQVELVLAAVVQDEEHAAAAVDWEPPTTAAERLALQQCLREAMDSGPDQRLEAVTLAGRWGHASVLPLLRRGLRDADSRVMEAAAAALDHRRGAPKQPAAQVARPPCNVARMR